MQAALLVTEHYKGLQTAAELEIAAEGVIVTMENPVNSETERDTSSPRCHDCFT